MNNSDKLDELFGMARKEPSLFSEEEMRNLLEEKNNSNKPAKVNFVELIIGVPNMLKIGFALAVATIGGLISTAMFDDSNLKIAQNNPQQSKIVVEKQMSVETNQNVTEQVNPDEPKQKKVYLIKQQLIDDTKAVPEENKNQIVPVKDVIEFKPVEVKGIQFITLSEEKLKLLGINTDNKELKYWNNWGTHDDKATLCTLFVNGGLAIRPKNNPDYDLIPNPGISPRLITDNKGNRRVFVTDDEDKMVLNSQYDQKFTNADSQKIAVSTIIYNELDTEFDNLKLSMHPSIAKSTIKDNEFLMNIPDELDSTIKLDNSELLNEIDQETDLSAKEKEKIKKILGNLFDDSIRVIVKKTQMNDSKTNIESEVITRNNTAVIQINVDKDSTNSVNNPVWISSTSSGEIILPNLNSLIIDSDPVLMGTNNKVINNIQTNIDEYIKINKLIPILVPFGKVESDNELIDKNNFGFILWYDPTPELLEVLPKEIREILEKELDSYSKTDDVCQSTAIAGEEPYLEVWRSCSGAIEHLNVNPVPANSIINVNYSLKEARRTTISIHDMFGNVIKELQSGKSEGTGNCTVDFDISKYESGMYLISVQTENGEAAVQRIVIER